MTFGLGRLYLSPPITARNLCFSSHNKATRNSPPQCQLRRQNHGGGGVKFDLAGNEPILNPGFGLSQNGIDKNTGSNTRFMRRFCSMYFGRRRRISSASGSSNPPEEYDFDQNGYGGDGGNRDKIHGNDGGRGDGDRALGYSLLALLGWHTIMWWCWSQYEGEYSSPEPYKVVKKEEEEEEEPSISTLQLIGILLLVQAVVIALVIWGSSLFLFGYATPVSISMCVAVVLGLEFCCAAMWLLRKLLKWRRNRGDGGGGGEGTTSGEILIRTYLLSFLLLLCVAIF
ncbi:hypothetical protein LINPERPRIM_LOCUS19182 [Linum perenne]